STGSNAGTVYLRRTDGSLPKRLAASSSIGMLSPDERLVLDSDASPLGVAVFNILPTGAGQAQHVTTEGVNLAISEYRRNRFFPDQKSVLFSGYQKGHGLRIWVQDLEGGKTRPITPENTSRPVLMGDGRLVCARGPDFEWYLYPVSASGEPSRVMGILPGEDPIRSTPDGKWLYVRGADELKPGETLMTTRVYRVDPPTALP